MPTVTGAWAPNSSANARGQLILNYTVPTPTAGQTQITVTGNIVVKAGPYSWYDSSNKLSWSGSLLGSGSVSNINMNVGNNGSQTIHTFSKVVTLTSGSQNLSVSFTLTGIGYINASPTVSATVTIPAQVVAGSPPAAPTNFVISYNASTNAFSTSWGGGPVQRIEVATKALNSTTWSAYTLYGTGNYSTGISLTATPGFTHYYRILRSNAFGNSNWTYSNAADATVVPNAPSTVTITQNSSSNHTVDWAFTASSAEHTPTSFVIERWRASTNTWVPVTSPWHATRTWTDTSNLSNDRIAWRVAAKNGAGQSAWTTSSYVMTAPRPATNVTAGRSGDTSAIVSWTTNTPTAVGVTQDLQFRTSPDSETWSAWANFSGKTGLSGSLQTTTVTGLNSTLRYQFRIVTRVSSPSHSATSVESAVVALPAAPNPPTPLAPLSYSVNASTSTTQFRWNHNTVDGSTQQAYDLRYRNVSTPGSPGAWVELSGSTDNYRDVSVAVGDWEWQVRTRGSFATYSPWSPVVVFAVYDPPSVTITSPSTPVVVTNKPTVSYTYIDSRGAQKTQIRRLLSSSSVVLEEVHTNTTSTSFQFSTFLENFTSYTIEVIAVSNTGLQSIADSYSFSTDFLEPGAAELEGAWDPDTGIASFQSITSATTPTVVTNRLERSIDGGVTWTEVQDGLGPNPEVLDKFARLNTVTQWRLISVSDLGTETASNIVTLETETLHSWLHYGPQQSSSIRLCAEIDNGLSFTSGATTHKLLGRNKRVSVHALDWSPEVTIKVSASVLDEWVGDVERQLMIASQGDVYWRDYQQREMWAVMTVGDGKPAWKYSFFGFTLEEIEGQGRPGG